MAAVPITINGVICDLYGRTIQGPVKIVGEMVRSDVGIGGGPIIPPEGEKPPIDPDLRPEHPIFYPPAVPPALKPPEAPAPGSPTTAVPGNWPVAPIVPPEYLVVQYPGIGPVIVAPPAASAPV